MYGTNTCYNYLAALQPAPPPGGGSYEAWQCTSIKACGPIGLLLHQLHDYCMGMTGDLNIVDSQHLSFHLMHAPWQHLRKLVHLAGSCVKSMQVKVTRSDMQHFTLFDGPLYQQMLKHIPGDQRNRLKLVHCLGSASDAKIASFNATLSPACQHCGDPDGSIDRKCWSCPTLKHVRFTDAEHPLSLLHLLKTLP